MSSRAEPILVLLTAPDHEEANRLAEMLVGTRLAACVQLIPEIRSVYRWQGKVENAAEVMVLAKSVREKFNELEQAIRANHSYETPEIIALSISDLSEPYLKWMIGELKTSAD